jgi:hypothetical protein
VPVGVWLGRWLQQQVDTAWFYKISQVCLFATGLQLIYQRAGTIG